MYLISQAHGAKNDHKVSGEWGCKLLFNPIIVFSINKDFEIYEE